jgi:hypothetical protein
VKRFRGFILGSFFALVVVGCGQGAIPGISGSTATGSDGTSIPAARIRTAPQTANVEPPIVMTPDGPVADPYEGFDMNMLPPVEYETFGGSSN